MEELMAKASLASITVNAQLKQGVKIADLTLFETMDNHNLSKKVSILNC